MALRMNGRLEVRVDDPTERRLDSLCELTGRNRAELIRWLIRQAEPVAHGGVALTLATPPTPAREAQPAPAEGARV